MNSWEGEGSWRREPWSLSRLLPSLDTCLRWQGQPRFSAAGNAQHPGQRAAHGGPPVADGGPGLCSASLERCSLPSSSCTFAHSLDFSLSGPLSKQLLGQFPPLSYKCGFLCLLQPGLRTCGEAGTWPAKANLGFCLLSLSIIQGGLQELLETCPVPHYLGLPQGTLVDAEGHNRDPKM